VKYSILTFGCRVNQADSFELERELQTRGDTRSTPDVADLVVVNTCSVTSAADQAARHAIRHVARLNARARIVATGCYATRQPLDLASLPGVVRVLGNDGKDAFVAAMASVPGQVLEPGVPGAAPAAPGPGAGGRTAYPLRVQTGCDERCRYCIVPSTRGPSRSRPFDQVLARVRRLVACGYKEVWLTGVHLGSYGRDLSPACSLVDLLRALDRLPGDLSLRISSLEPMDCTSGIVDVVARSGRFLPHLHLPMQHASDRVLAAMGRPYAFETCRRLFDRVRERMPDAAIGTDVIVGFPGETEADFDALADYVRESPLTHLHVFPYSDRPGTDAVRLRPKVEAAAIHRRARRLRETARTLGARFAERQLGSVRPGLTLEDGSLVLTDNYLKVRIGPGRLRNERVGVRLVSNGPLRGEVVA
jgi:threonylcarbamoyladenosine tRNA methylthiotransferase MtaB